MGLADEFVKYKKTGLDLTKYAAEPAAFVREVLKFEPDKWQEEVLADLARYPKITVRSGQGVGKTGLIACSLIWFLCCFKNSRVVATAATYNQLTDGLWAEAAKWLRRDKQISKLLVWTKTHIYVRGHEEIWFAAARTAAKAENIQGYHADDMLFIVDEASGVADGIMEAVLGTLSGGNNKLLMCGNPTRRSGVFYDSHTVDRELYRTYKVSAADSLRTNKDNIASMIRKYGEHSNVVRVRVFGEFPIDDDGVFMSTETVMKGVHNEPDLSKILTIDIGVDVARFGDDNTAIAVKLNNAVQPLTVINGADTVETASRVLNLCRQLFTKHAVGIRVKVDDTGVGGGVTDMLRHSRLPFVNVMPINFARAVRHAYYADFSTFAWGNVKELLDAGELVLPNDNDLIGELTSRKKEFSANGKIKIESKKDMKKRGLPSPDRSDAVCLAALGLAFGEDNGGGRKSGQRRSGKRK